MGSPAGKERNMVLRKVGLMVLLLIGLAIPVAGQEAKVNVIEDRRLAELVEKHIAINKHQGGVMEGYRVQIFFDSGAESKKRALEVKTDFQAKYPEVPAYLSFSEPFFKIRVGDFRHKVEADGLLHVINTVYPNAFIVRDKISFPRID
jgi:hypothetical protein